MKTKQNKEKNVTLEKGNIASANKNAKKRPEGARSRHVWLIKYGERTCTSTLALGYPLLGLFRLIRAYWHTTVYAVVQPWLSLQLRVSILS